ncbi:MAG: XTP/dITP diphosphatase [Desulfurococcaceae archaeon]
MLPRICIVTSNEHKFSEIKEVALEYGLEVEMCPGLKLEIQSDDLADIVFKSALIAYMYLNKPIIVEDAGLFIDALNGFPGPYSSYVYRTIGINGILKLMNDASNRRACFRSAVALVINNRVFSATGEVCGEIATKPRGAGGFGFDPIFVPEGDSRTFAEMSIHEKNKYSHRAKAVRKVFELLFK